MKALKWLARMGAVLLLALVIAKIFRAYYEAIPRALLDKYEDFSVFLSGVFGIASVEDRGDLYLVIVLATCVVISAVLVVAAEGLWRHVGRFRGAAGPRNVV